MREVAMNMAFIDALYLYPIKSLRGVSVDSAQVTDRGFKMDRRLMLVDEAGQFVSQRAVPALTTFEVELGVDQVAVSRQDVGKLQVPLHVGAKPSVPVEIWDTAVMASPVGPAFDAYFSKALGRPLRLVYMPDVVQRPVSTEWVPEGGTVSFADGFPYLVVTKSALELVSERSAEAITAARFRPNLVISGPSAHAEDEWFGFEVGQTRFTCVKPCDRCSMVGLNPTTGESNKEPLRSMAKYRKRHGKVLFGQNLMAQGIGQIRVGDAVRVLPPPPSL